ncbi:DUF1629 domain-containing protein [Clostridium sp. YIM B02506]|uniref:imm11 family protein n=1 Tax=Clostridium sp. YIM B02506 TaxID=2910680 RepID=UPI0031B6088B
MINSPKLLYRNHKEGDFMNYFTLQYDMKKYENSGVMAYHNKIYEFDMYDVTSGSYINKWDKRVTFTFSESDGSELTDYICNDFGWIIVSDSFKKAFENEGMTGIQFLQVSVINKDNDIEVGIYYVANIINLIAAVDKEKSEYFELAPDRYSFVSFVLKEEAIRDFDIFRLKEYDVQAFASERFKKMIKNNKLTGFNFNKVKIV